LASELPNARLEWVDDAFSFSPEDNPERVAELIAGFCGPLATGTSGASQRARQDSNL
jgi:hypothetical protein